MNLKLQHARFLFTELQRPLHLDEKHDELSDFDLRFRLILRKHLTVLGWWSILNILGSVAALMWFSGTTYYFFMMGLVWGGINFAVAIGVFNHTFYRKFRKGDSFERFEAQRHVEKLLFLNIGVDSAYLFAGLLLREHSFVEGVKDPELWLGFGWSVVVQGLFLLVQDIAFYRLHRRNFRKAQPFLEVLLGAGKSLRN
ncbi:MAG: hypothetical protein HUU01_08005 [Saprospiraceae bacterium]|nr:hypothetical protein [Saprospiraceae bacterium]